MEGRLTKKELKEQRKLENLRKMEETKNGSSRMKWIVIVIASVLFLAFATFLIIAAKQKPQVKVNLSNSGWATGNTKSKVTVTEFGDFQCPACGAFEPVMLQLRQDYGKKVKIVFMHFPLTSVHPNAMEAAMAAEAAGAQDKFWQYHDLLYEKQEVWAPLADPTQQFIAYAKELKLDTDKFKKDLGLQSAKDKINNQENEGIKVGVNSTPSVFVNGVIQENRSYSAISSVIDKLLSNTK